MVDILNTIGWFLVDSVMIPLLLWTIVAGLLLIIAARKTDSISPSLHYHGRIGLIIALPVGMAGSWLINYLSVMGSVSAPLKFYIIQNPLPANLSVEVSNNFLLDPIFWMGLIGIALVAGFVIHIYKILKEVIQLNNYNKNFQFSRLNKYDDFTELKSVTQVDSRRILLAFSKKVLSAFTYGWLHPKIVIPSFLKNNKQKIKMVLHHELTHIKRGDFLLNAFIVWIKAFFWFHPLVHYLFNDILEYREILCDTEVLSSGNNFSKKQYALLIFELAQKNSGPGIAMNMTGRGSKVLKNRIKMITLNREIKNNHKKSLLVSLVAAILLILTLSFTDINSYHIDVSDEENLVSESLVQPNQHSQFFYMRSDGKQSNWMYPQIMSEKKFADSKIQFSVKAKKITDVKHIKPEYISPDIFLKEISLKQVKKGGV